ncbi:MAG: Asp-tRNA(Asn)/Glu-tRNA(Gln) amidotransferase subunit GatA [Anaerovoracaceae bacterium]
MDYERICEMTALQLGQAIKEKKITSVEAAEAVLTAIEESEPQLHAYITVCREEALDKAQAVDAALAAGDSGLLASPLAGVPIAIKDNICTKGIKTSCASKILGEFAPFYDATVMEKLEAAGAVVIGKTNMDEFAMGSTTETSAYGPTLNPWDAGRVPGGSSGGSAAAVGARAAVCALGSDTGGSIRQPAAYCGVTGFKPTYGTVSRYGLIAYASSLDQIGPIAKDVKDCAALMDIISGYDEMDGTSLPQEMQHTGYLGALTGDISGMRIGIPTEAIEKGLEPDVKQAILDMGQTLKELGAEVEEISLPFLDYVIPTYYIIAAAEASSNLSRFDGVRYGFRAEGYEDLTEMYSKTRSQGFGEEVKKRILLGTFVLSSGYYDAYYKKALQVKAIIKQEFDKIFSKYDAILLPAAPATAPKLGESLADPLKMYLSDIFTVSVNIAGLPGLSVPSGFDQAGMPVGTQIIGPALGDADVLNIGYAFQQATEYHKAAPSGKCSAPSGKCSAEKEVR